MNVNFRWVLFVGLTFGLMACTQVQPLEVRSVTCCQLKKAVKTEAEITFDVEMYNPNPFPINIKNYNLDVMVNGNAIGNSSDRQMTAIPSNTTVSKTITVKASAQELIGGSLLMGLGTLMGNQPKALEVEVVGHVTGNAKGVSKRVRIREKYPIDLRQ